MPENKSKSVDPSISLIDSNTKIENPLELDKEHGIVDKADFIESIKEKLFSKEQKKVDNEAAIDFQIINFTRLEGEIRVSRTELYAVEDFD